MERIGMNNSKLVEGMKRIGMDRSNTKLVEDMERLHLIKYRKIMHSKGREVKM